MKRKLLVTTAGLLTASLALNSCTTAAVATTGLVLASAGLAVGAYAWMKKPDAYNAYQKDAETVYKAAGEALSDANFKITGRSEDQKKLEYTAVGSTGDELTVVVKKDNANLSELFIKGNKAESTIILNKVNASLDAKQTSYDMNTEAKTDK